MDLLTYSSLYNIVTRTCFKAQYWEAICNPYCYPWLFLVLQHSLTKPISDTCTYYKTTKVVPTCTKRSDTHQIFNTPNRSKLHKLPTYLEPIRTRVVIPITYLTHPLYQFPHKNFCKYIIYNPYFSNVIQPTRDKETQGTNITMYHQI